MTPLFTMTVPLREDEAGGLKIGDTRIPLERVVYAYQHGQTPEQIVRSYPDLKLAEVYAVISFYLENLSEVDAYIKRREQEAEAIRRDIETNFPSRELRTRLLARRQQVQE